MNRRGRERGEREGGREREKKEEWGGGGRGRTEGRMSVLSPGMQTIRYN